MRAFASNSPLYSELNPCQGATLRITSFLSAYRVTPKRKLTHLPQGPGCTQEKNVATKCFLVLIRPNPPRECVPSSTTNRGSPSGSWLPLLQSDTTHLSNRQADCQRIVVFSCNFRNFRGSISSVSGVNVHHLHGGFVPFGTCCFHQTTGVDAFCC